MGKQSSKAIKATQPTIKKPIDNSQSHEIAKQMQKMNIQAVKQINKTTQHRPKEIPACEKISISTCRLLFQDATTLSTKELSDKYRLQEDLIKKLTTSYGYVEGTFVDPSVKTQFGRKSK